MSLRLQNRLFGSGFVVRPKSAPRSVATTFSLPFALRLVSPKNTVFRCERTFSTASGESCVEQFAIYNR
jgi:hypothetical protein